MRPRHVPIVQERSRIAAAVEYLPGGIMPIVLLMKELLGRRRVFPAADDVIHVAVRASHPGILARLPDIPRKPRAFCPDARQGSGRLRGLRAGNEQRVRTRQLWPTRQHLMHQLLRPLPFHLPPVHLVGDLAGHPRCHGLDELRILLHDRADFAPVGSLLLQENI